ncbi:MAG: DeoR family transcriptional regulator [Holdemanella porci]
MKYNRIQEIENYIKNAKVASLDELLNQFDISIQTLRRDLKELENRNVIKKYMVELSITRILSQTLRLLISNQEK